MSPRPLLPPARAFLLVVKNGSKILPMFAAGMLWTIVNDGYRDASVSFRG